MSWSIPLDRLAEKTGLKLDTVARKVTLDLFTSVVQKSPVDTGRFKANWNVGTTPNLSFTASTNASRGLSEAQKAIGISSGGVVYLSNGLPYARRLEYGWSGQAPAGMVRLSVREFRQFVERAIQ
ncbi:MAG: HK97 gp10 family phage protein [Sulfuricella sp.]